MHILNIQVKQWGPMFFYEVAHYEEPSGEFVRHIVSGPHYPTFREADEAGDKQAMGILESIRLQEQRFKAFRHVPRFQTVQGGAA